jgi:hypothetical protein
MLREIENAGQTDVLHSTSECHDLTGCITRIMWMEVDKQKETVLERL